MVLDIDKNASDFHPSLRAIENYDLAAILEYFDELENAAKTQEFKSQTGIDFESETYRSLYKKISDISYEIKTSGKDVNIEPLLTKKELDILRYVIRYQRGVYSTNQEVVDIHPGNGDGNADNPGSGILNDEEVSGSFTLYDNGYYLIEMNSSGGYLQYDDDKNDYIDNCAYLFNPNNKKIDDSDEDGIPVYKSLTVWVTDDKSSMITFHEHMVWVMSIDKKYYYGRYETNGSNFILFTDKNFDEETSTFDDNGSSILSVEDRYQTHQNVIESLKKKTITIINDKSGEEELKDTNLGLSSIEIDYADGFFDFFSLSFDVLNTQKFMVIELNTNKLKFYAYYDDKTQKNKFLTKIDDLYEKTDLFIGLDALDAQHPVYNIPKYPLKRNGKLNIDGDFLLNTLKGCVSQINDNDNFNEYGRSFEIMASAFLWLPDGETLNQWRVRSLARTLNKYPAGNGGHIYAIVKLKTSNSHMFSYSFNKGAVKLYNGENETSSSTTFNISIGSGDEYKYGGSDDVSMLKVQQDAEKDFSFYIGTENIYDDAFVNEFGEDTFKKVCCVDDESYGIKNAKVSIRRSTDGKQFQVYGNGGKGQGIRLNEFGAAYFQNHEDSFIKITYLGNDAIKTTKMSFVKNSDNDILETIQPGLIYIDENGSIHSGGFGWNGQDDDSILIPRYSTVDFELSTIDLRDNIVLKSALNEDEDDVFNNIKVERSFNRYRFSLENLTDEKYDIKLSVGRNFGFFYDVLGDFSDKEAEFPVKSINGIQYDDKRNSRGYNLDDCLDHSNFGIYANFVTQSYDLNSTLLSLYNNECHNRQMLSIQDEDNFNFVKRTTTLQVSNAKNLRIFQNLVLITELSINIQNSLNLPKVQNDDGSFIYEDEYDRTIDIATYKLLSTDDSGNSTDSFNVFPFNKNKRFIEGSKILIKFEFNSSRIEIDQVSSQFPIGTIFYQKNYDVLNSVFVEYNTDTERTFQYVELTQPNMSFIINAIVKQTLYSFTLKRDLYNILNLSIINNKESFEYGEQVILQFQLLDYLRISSLFLSRKNKSNILQATTTTDSSGETDYGDEAYNGNTYRVFNYEYSDNEIYESFFCLKSLYNSKIYNLSDSRQIQKIFNFTLKSSREFNGFFENYENALLPIIAAFSKQKSLNVFDEVITLYFSMPKQNVVCRFTSDYLPFKNVFSVDNGTFANIDILKPYNFLLMMNSGPTGNGGDGASGLNDATAGYNGGWGGDGFYSGNGGNGNRTGRWAIGINRWKGFLPTGLSLNVWLPGCPAPYGAGVFTGTAGEKGAATFGKNRAQDGLVYVNDVALSRNNVKWVDRQTVYYDSVKVIAAIDFKYNFLSSNGYKKLTSYQCETYAGLKGSDGVNGGTQRENGSNGCAGGPSWISMAIPIDSQGQDVSGFNIKIQNDLLSNYYNGNSYTGEEVKGIFAFGGSHGSSRTWNLKSQTHEVSVWSTWNNHHDNDPTNVSLTAYGAFIANQKVDKSSPTFSILGENLQVINLYKNVDKNYVCSSIIKDADTLIKKLNDIYIGLFRTSTQCIQTGKPYIAIKNEYPQNGLFFFKNVGGYDKFLSTSTSSSSSGSTNKISVFSHGYSLVAANELNQTEYINIVTTANSSSSSSAGITKLLTLGECYSELQNNNNYILKRLSYSNFVTFNSFKDVMNLSTPLLLGNNENDNIDEYGNYKLSFYIKDLNTTSKLLSSNVSLDKSLFAAILEFSI